MEEAGLPVWQYVETSSTVNLILYNIFDERLVYKNKVLISVIAKILDKFGQSYSGVKYAKNGVVEWSELLFGMLSG